MSDRNVEPLGRRLFWVKSTGNIIAQRGEMAEGIESTKEEDFEVYIELKGINPEGIEMTTFEPGEYEEDFMTAVSWRFNPDTKTIEFLRLDPNAPTHGVPIYQKPLSEQVTDLELKMDEKDRENKAALFEIYSMLLGAE